MMMQKKVILDTMIVNGLRLAKPYFWYLEFYTLEELIEFSKRFYKKA